jgi:hypothetical protein
LKLREHSVLPRLKKTLGVAIMRVIKEVGDKKVQQGLLAGAPEYAGWTVRRGLRDKKLM